MAAQFSGLTSHRRRRSLQRLIRLSSGLLVTFVAFGFGSWFSGAVTWAGFYLGARGEGLIRLAQVSVAVGFAIAIVGCLAWFRRRCGRGSTEISGWAVLTAFLVLPLGNIFWAVFTDAIAYHYGQDIVRPAVDIAVMCLILGGVVPLAVFVPWVVSRGERKGVRDPSGDPIT